MHYGISVSNASLKIAAHPGMEGLPEFTAGATYAIGDCVTSNRLVYMALSAGTAGATAPTGVGIVSDGTLSWVSTIPRVRKGITIVNEGSIALYVSMNGPAVANRGVMLAASGGSLTLSGDTAEQCAFYAIRGAATAGNVAILEW